MVSYNVPLLWSVQTRKFVEGATDVRGQPKDTWAEPVTQKVYGWSSPVSKEQRLRGHDEMIIVQLELLVPKGFDCGPYDKVTVPGFGELDAIGLPEDYNHGPFGFEPGLVVNLGRADG